MAANELNDKQGRTTVVSGTTNATPDTKQLFYFSPKQLPQHWTSTSGDVYSPANGLGLGIIDVRSRLASHAFTIKLFF